MRTQSVSVLPAEYGWYAARRWCVLAEFDIARGCLEGSSQIGDVWHSGLDAHIGTRQSFPHNGRAFAS